MKKNLISMMLALVMVLTLTTPAFAMDTQHSKAPETSEEIAACFDTVIAEGTIEEIPLTDCVITQYSAENGDIVHITELDNGNKRYEYYCRANEVIYSYIESPELSPTSIQNEPIYVTFDVAAYREANTIKYELSNTQEAEIRGIMKSCNTQEECQQQLDKAGYTDITIEENDGITIASINPNAQVYARAIKTIDPTKEEITDYEYSWRVRGSSSPYNSTLRRNIQCRVYEFADNFVEKDMKLTYVSAGKTLLDVASICLTATNVIEDLINLAGILISGNSLLEAFNFRSEQAYTYVAEKSGWTYDYVTPYASGRHGGYAICYYNSTLGKMQMCFDGTSRRSNFHWTQTNLAIANVYDKNDSEILNGAYTIYSAAIINNGVYSNHQK